MGQHKYMELANKLRLDIQTGVYSSGQKLPSENELAALTGYSRQTVRQAIGALVDDGLVRRVQGSGTYVDSGANHREPTHNIAVVTTYIGEYIFPAILHGLEGTLTQNGYTSMLLATGNRVDNERRILTDLLTKPIDGLIVEGTKTALPNPNIDLYSAFAQKGIPVVFINGYYTDIKNPIYVVADDQKAGQMAADILLKKGHTRIAGIFKSDDMQGHRRYAGFAQELCAHNIAVADNQILWYTTENKDNLINACVLAVTEGCTAVVCYNDEIALLLQHILTNHNIDPQSIEIVSFDNSKYAQISAYPFLSLSSPTGEIGRIAAEKMIHLLEKQSETSAVLPWTLGTTL